MENPLLELIDKDTTVKEPDKDWAKHLAELYQKDFEDNLFKTSIELTNKYKDVSANEWFIWLEIPSIKKYRNHFIQEQINAQNNLSLAQGEKTQGAVQVRKMLDERSDNSMANFIVMRLPDREE